MLFQHMLFHFPPFVLLSGCLDLHHTKASANSTIMKENWLHTVYRRLCWTFSWICRSWSSWKTACRYEVQRATLNCVYATHHPNSSVQSRNLGSESSQGNTWNNFHVTFSLDDCPHHKEQCSTMLNACKCLTFLWIHNALGRQCAHIQFQEPWSNSRPFDILVILTFL